MIYEQKFLVLDCKPSVTCCSDLSCVQLGFQQGSESICFSDYPWK